MASGTSPRKPWRWALVLTPLLLFAPLSPGRVLYKAVDATEHFPSGTCDQRGCWTDDLVAEGKVEGRTEKLFAIHRGRLFLRFQRTWSSMLLVTWVDFDRWNEDRIADLRRDHPELEPLWPEPGRKDGGLGWPREGQGHPRAGPDASSDVIPAPSAALPFDAGLAGLPPCQEDMVVLGENWMFTDGGMVRCRPTLPDNAGWMDAPGR